jgi:hypothetical protein
MLFYGIFKVDALARKHKTQPPSLILINRDDAAAIFRQVDIMFTTNVIRIEIKT